MSRISTTRRNRRSKTPRRASSIKRPPPAPSWRLKAELDTLKALESLALGVRRSADTKWRELASLLGEIFTATGRDGRTGEPAIRDGDGAIPRPAASPHQKLVVFTEHRDTLRYLQERITTLLGRQTSVVVIHGSVGREERLAAQEAFKDRLHQHVDPLSWQRRPRPVIAELNAESARADDIRNQLRHQSPSPRTTHRQIQSKYSRSRVARFL